ncbi:MAG: glycosyltransferase family 4 protein [Candidatus Bathycorpusculaceae bacterium]
MKVMMFSQLMYGGAWRRNYNVLRNMTKVDKKIEYISLLEASNAKLIPDVDKIVSDLKKLYEIKFIKLPPILEKFTQLHYTYINKLSATFNQIIGKEKVDLVYVPHEIDWWILTASHASKGFIPWTALFHSMPLFVCILKVKKEGTISTLLDAPSLKYKPFRTARGLYRYFRLQKLVKVLKDTLSLSVSKSISWNLKTFYPWLNVEALNPGVGIDLDYISSIQHSTRTFDAIYFTSELIPQKGFLELPKIWKNVVQQTPNARLLVVGKSYKEYLEQFLSLIEKLDLKKNIFLSELLPHNELISLVKSSKLTVYPSTFDAFPMIVLESLASGVPVVAYDISAIKLNYVTKSVVKCPVNDVKCLASNVVTLLSDDKLRRKLSQEAIAYAAGFSWENVARKEAEGYRKVLDFWSSK